MIGQTFSRRLWSTYKIHCTKIYRVFCRDSYQFWGWAAAWFSPHHDHAHNISHNPRLVAGYRKLKSGRRNSVAIMVCAIWDEIFFCCHFRILYQHLFGHRAWSTLVPPCCSISQIYVGLAVGIHPMPCLYILKPTLLLIGQEFWSHLKLQLGGKFRAFSSFINQHYLSEHSGIPRVAHLSSPYLLQKDLLIICKHY